MVVIIDYGMGNLKSVYNALNKIGCRCKVSSEVRDIRTASGLILPGVGAFKDCMDNLTKSNLDQILKEEVEKGKPLLGICLGMQVLFEKGYEGEERAGLGLLKGKIVRMEDPNVKIPHIGWNNLEKNREDELISISEKAPFVYYVHSYYAQDYNDEDLVGFSYYGSLKIPGLVIRKNVMGAQFHPEKSGEAGLNILRNFKELI
ncbi:MULTISPECIES: imidazole glycerol phosphate synthase subunit HisH [Clostridium]|uniref:Imidazole glycerol phosphate synthase subunit HisH n=1 Tax=Clostridium paraputrificum TaxID=29363 RepID=A0A1B8RPJ9_9CLOT|nr:MULTISPECIES: imidazole glycerol phosphate synthase subunit HisH [Clostridium]MDB2102715.1 imidazole glycerol phosphate synthase subunit HisH [Clostridium paraputrificum]MDC0801167.1 imidazole glycerol phosphate synthase subunit HisH [Clostridium paraputrificum]MDU1823664.1 imidazole glycerol phosphate synthase subunit HisH [Clostridium sp.]MDU1840850.1 imidazole glycerol phosphate synthase subunit HisH [Clostridium sp.]MDU2690971.1 imidazole glycerol phosphate synthase subunit HisH [Clostr